jgi:hypothetical protein
MATRNGVIDELVRQTTPPEDVDLVDGSESRADAPGPRKRSRNGSAGKRDRKDEGGKLTVRRDILWRLHIWSQQRGVSMKTIADGILDRHVPRFQVTRIGKPIDGEE